MNTNEINPQYAFTSHEIDMVNANKIHTLERDWIKITGNERIVEPPKYLSQEESERLGIAGSSYNDILDFDHAQEPALMVLSMANDYAYSVKRKVTAMYEEAYDANTYAGGPTKYYALENSKQEFAKSYRGRVSQFLGALINR